VILPQKIAQGVADGTVTVAFRRWAAPRVLEARSSTPSRGWSGSARSRLRQPGLTHSLDVGYRIAPCGAAYLAATLDDL